MAVSGWIFIITLVLPTFGGGVRFEGTFTSEAACNKVRTLVIKQLGVTDPPAEEKLGDRHVTTIVRPCEEKKTP